MSNIEYIKYTYWYTNEDKFNIIICGMKNYIKILFSLFFRIYKIITKFVNTVLVPIPVSGAPTHISALYVAIN